MINKRTLEDFFEHDYKEYALSTVKERSIPSLSDGLKPSGRKILYSALKSLSETTPHKLTHLIGSIYSLTAYQHGDASLEKTIINLGSEYKDGFAPLTIVGAGATLRDQKNAAPRYLAVKLSKYAQFYNLDSEIFEYNYDGEQRIEPTTFLPLIPLSLCKRDKGIALGYAYSNEMSFSVDSIIDSCLSVLKGKSENINLIPYVKEFKGKYEIEEDRKFKTSSIYEIKENRIIIQDLPINETYISFENNLNKLLEKDIITNYENQSEDDEIKYVIHCNKSTIDKLIKDDKLEKIFHLSYTTSRPNITMLLPNGKLHIFESYEEVIEKFVEFRLSKYPIIKNKKLESINDKIEHNNDLLKFIDLVIKKELKINNRSIKDIKKDLKKLSISEDGLKLSISKLTKEEYEKLKKENIKLNKEYEKLNKTTPKDLYITALKEMKKTLQVK